MRIKISLIGSLRKYIDDEPFKYIEVDENSSVLEILSIMGINVRRVMVIVNGKRTTTEHIPVDSDSIKIIPVVTGG